MLNEILLNAVDRFERIRNDYVSNIIVDDVPILVEIKEAPM